ncbi:MAG: DNA alkylation repair protein [Bacteroidota bacterium]
MQKQVITGKKQIQHIIAQLKENWLSGRRAIFWKILREQILEQKVKHPVLDHVGRRMAGFVEAYEQVELIEKLADEETQAGYVVAGALLETRVEKDFVAAFALAVELIEQGNEWYVCDGMAERVFASGLLRDHRKGVLLLEELADNSNDWVRRAPGVAVHFAVKRGVSDEAAKALLELLQPQFGTRNFQIKKGIGLAVETIARRHPDVARAFEGPLTDTATNIWIRNKYAAGLKKSEGKKGE